MLIIEPFTIRFKLLMKKFFENEIPLMWDEPIDDNFKESWIELIAEAVKAEMIIFPRKARPEKSFGRPRVVGFEDGAFPSFGGCVYLVWKHACDNPEECCLENCKLQSSGSMDQHEEQVEGHYSAHLVLAKDRVKPLRGYTIQRS